MYETLPDEIRDAPPYFMIEEIKAQPEAVARSLELVAERGRGAQDALARARRVFVTGCGTSFHAAQAGAYLLRALSAGTVDARAAEAFELLNYSPGLRPDDVVLAVTHTGATFMTLRALEAADRAGAETVTVTGFPESEAARMARHAVPTGYHGEKSWAHTISYTAALASFAALANGLAPRGERLDLAPLPEVVAESLQLEEMAHRLAASWLALEPQGGDIILVGGGGNAVTAREARLKLWETSYTRAQAFELEEILHGPLAAVTSACLLILIAPPGPSSRRASQLSAALGALDLTPVALVGDENASDFPDDHRFLLPDLPEALSPITYVVPLQLFAYYLALGKGTNPDLIGRDAEQQREARSKYE